MIGLDPVGAGDISSCNHVVRDYLILFSSLIFDVDYLSVVVFLLFTTY